VSSKRRFAAWAFGIFFALMALVSLVASFPAALLLLLAAAVTLPPTSRRLQQKITLLSRSWVRILVVVIAFSTAMRLMGGLENTRQQLQNTPPPSVAGSEKNHFLSAEEVKAIQEKQAEDSRRLLEAQSPAEKKAAARQAEEVRQAAEDVRLRKEAEKDKSYIVACAQQVVESMLKSPSTAKFPWSIKRWAYTPSSKEWEVASYVDSQNSFGAVIRTDWICKTDFNPHEEACRATCKLYE
jgi:ABC-type multidrug transport system fused ATPase/permease subunit